MALRWVSDEPQPGVIEISVFDAYGQDHRVFEKDIVTSSPLTKDAPFPIEFWIEAETHDASDGYVKAILPWRMETTTGETELTLFASSSCPRSGSLKPCQNLIYSTILPRKLANANKC